MCNTAIRLFILAGKLILLLSRTEITHTKEVPTSYKFPLPECKPNQSQANTTDTNIPLYRKKARCHIKDSHQRLHYPDFNSIDKLCNWIAVRTCNETKHLRNVIL